MKIARNPAQLKIITGGGCDFICPNCQDRHLYEANVGQLTISCPTCNHKWRVDSNGKPVW